VAVLRQRLVCGRGSARDATREIAAAAELRVLGEGLRAAAT
jgi:hypothetical protein